MAEFVFFLILIIPAVLGISEMLHTAKHYLYSHKKTGKQVLIATVSDDSFRTQLVNIADQRNWYAKMYPQRIFIVMNGISSENTEECDRLIKKLNLEIYSQEKLAEHLKGG